MRRRQLLLSTLSLPLGGCLAVPYGTYYRPSSPEPGARRRGAWCQGQAGPPTVLELDVPGGVRLWAQARREYLERDRVDLPLKVELVVPGSVPLRFLGAAAMVRESGSGASIAAPLKARARGKTKLPPDAWVDSAALRPAGALARPGDSQAPYGRANWAFTAPPDFAPASLSVQLPDVELGAVIVTVPPIVISRPGSNRRPGDYRSAAEQEHLRNREAACHRDTPQLHCENIVPYGERSFELGAGPLLWEGRWSRFEGAAPMPPLQGRQTLVVSEARPWRLTEAAVVLTAPAGGATMTLRTPSLNMNFDDDIDLDTPLHAVAHAGRESTRLLLEFSLPPTPPSFVLTLPPLQVGARRVDLAPLSFERRSFDGGIEPFNC